MHLLLPFSSINSSIASQINSTGYNAHFFMKAKKEEIKFKGLMNIQYKIYSYFHVWLLIEETLSLKNIHTLFSFAKPTKDSE
jgi:hypothetical protein